MSLNTLPPELLNTILSHLPIYSLLAFSLTSKANHTQHLQALHTLDIAIFPKRVQALIAFLQSSSADDDDITSSSPSNPYQLQSPHQIALIIPSPNRPSITKSRTKSKSKSKSSSTTTTTTTLPLLTPQSHRATIIHQQNHHLTTLLTRYPTLQNLTIHAWDLLPTTTTTLSTLSSLHSLTLHLDHSTSRDPCLPSSYFTDPALPSPMWNSLAGLGEQQARDLRLRGLRVLRLERVGCTSMQLRGIVGANRKLRELRCRKVRGVDWEFLNWLGGVGERSDQDERWPSDDSDSDEEDQQSQHSSHRKPHRSPPPTTTTTTRPTLSILRIDTCPSLILTSSPTHFTWLTNLSRPSTGGKLKDLRIENCDHVDELLLREHCDRLGLPVVTSAAATSEVQEQEHHQQQGGMINLGGNAIVEVDPMFCDPLFLKNLRLGEENGGFVQQGQQGRGQVMEVDESCL